MIKVLIVEDSLVAQNLLAHILNSDPQIEVIGIAKNGLEALEFLRHTTPDVITMDVNMPRMDGLETTRRIMETQPVPIVIVTASYDPEHVTMSFRAIEAGAVALLEKPHGPGHPNHQELANALTRTVKTMSEVKVVRRWDHYRKANFSPETPKVSQSITAQSEIQLIAIGSSTGGPATLQTILAKLPADFPVPILVVQHIATGFLTGLIDWLSRSVSLSIKVATHQELLKPGYVYFAPDGLQIGLAKNGRIVLSDAEAENSLRPSVSYLFRSVASTLGSQAVGVLLTGMGKDGAAELKLMKNVGAITIAQDADSSIVHGMPGEAIKLNAVTHVLSPEQIANLLVQLAKNRKA